RPSGRDRIAKSLARGAFFSPSSLGGIDMGNVNLALLGVFRLQTDAGEPVPLSTKKAGALLAYLALHSGQAQTRPKLAALLWGDRSDVQARDSLRQAPRLVRKGPSPVAPRPLIAHK